MSTVSASPPPCLRKWSMPAFSVTMLKLIARSIRTMANRAAFAISQPMTSIRIASSTCGRNSPTWRSEARIGSSSICMFSITSSSSVVAAPGAAWCGARSGARLEQLDDAAQRDARPVRPVLQFVIQLVYRLLDQEQFEQAVALRCRAGNAGRLRRVVVAIDECPPRPPSHSAPSRRRSNWVSAPASARRSSVACSA